MKIQNTLKIYTSATATKLRVLLPVLQEFTSLMFWQMSYPSEVHPSAHSHEKLPIVSTQTWVSYEDDHLIIKMIFVLYMIALWSMSIGYGP